jgi:DNA invertase Pin-like site-specific DNA recombinase
MRIATYLSCAQGEGRQLLDKQLREITHFIRAQKGWKLVKKYSDPFSLANEERPSFRQMLADAEKHRFEVLIFWSLDRLSQQGPLHSLRLLKRLADWGIQFRSISEPHLDTCGLFREAVSSVLATLAAQERNHLVRRTRVGLARQKRSRKPGPKGRIGPGRPPIPVDQEVLKNLCAARAQPSQIAAGLGVSKTTAIRLLKKL